MTSIAPSTTNLRGMPHAEDNLHNEEACSSLRSSAASSALHCNNFENPSILPCFLLSQPHSKNRKRILLQGPPQSGRTSLTMDLAYACAAAAAVDTSGSKKSFCHCAPSPSCVCTPVMWYRLRATPDSANHSNSKQDDFPMRCRYVGEAAALGITTPQKDRCEEEDWDPAVLRRIRIQYVSSIRALVYELLGLLGKPKREHPIKAILVDDLDLLASAAASCTWEAQTPPRQYTNSSETTTQMMQASK